MLENGNISPQTENAFLNLCEDRGMEPDKMLTIMIRSFAGGKKVFGLNDTLTFGKYNGLNCSDVIRADPSYAYWVVTSAENVGFTEEAIEEAYSCYAQLQAEKGAELEIDPRGDRYGR